MPELIAYLEMSQTTLDRQVYWTGVLDRCTRQVYWTGVIAQLTDDLQTDNIYTT